MKKKDSINVFNSTNKLKASKINANETSSGKFSDTNKSGDKSRNNSEVPGASVESKDKRKTTRSIIKYKLSASSDKKEFVSNTESVYIKSIKHNFSSIKGETISSFQRLIKNTPVKQNGLSLNKNKSAIVVTGERFLKMNSMSIPKIVSKLNSSQINTNSDLMVTNNISTNRSNLNIETYSQSINVNSSNIKVIVRFRPLNSIETDFIANKIGFITSEFPTSASVVIKTDQYSINTSSQYTYDKVFPPDTAQEDIYNFIGKDTILDVCNGYNGTIFTYGQSGSGKTFTMYGRDIFNEVNKGMIPRAIDHLFRIIENSNEDSVFQLKFSIMQIYKEVIYDLLTGDRDLKIKESPSKGIYVEGLSEFYIDNIENFLELLQMSQEQRIIAGTKLNQFSSRSHTIFVLEVNQAMTKQNFTKKGTLNLVDLAGTEKVSKTGAVGENLEEAKKINLSLSALGNVIHSLTLGSDHIPYRDSKLTRILQDSLGGNYKTALLVTCSPHSYHLEETISSLKFAQRAKTIKNKVKMNIKLSYEELQRIVANLKIELELSNKEVTCLKNLLNGSSDIGENIINIIQSQNVKQIIENDMINTDNKLIQAAGSNIETKINIVNNHNASSVNIILNEDIEASLKKLDLMNKRSSFIETSVKNEIKNIFINNKKENYIQDEVIDSVSIQIQMLNERIKLQDERISQLEQKVIQLENNIFKKDEILKENNKDILINCKDIYERLNTELKLSQQSSLLRGSLTILNNEKDNSLNNYNPNQILSLDVNLLCEKVNISLDKYTKFISTISKELGNVSKDDNKLITDKFYNIEKILSSLQLIYPESEYNFTSVLKESKESKEALPNLLKHIQYRLNIELVNIFNENLINQNRLLSNQYITLLNFFTEVTQLNQQLLLRLDNYTHEYNEDTRKLSFRFQDKSNMVGNNKIAKFLTKQSIRIMKNSHYKKSSMENGLLTNSNSLNMMPTGDNIQINNLHSENDHDNLSLDKSSLYLNTNQNTIINNNALFNFIIKTMDKSTEQFNALKDFILKSFTDFKKVKETFELLQEEIKFITSSNLKKSFLMTIQNTEMDDNSSTNTVIAKNNIIKNSKTIKSRYSLLNSPAKLDEIDENEEMSLQSNRISSFRPDAADDAKNIKSARRNDADVSVVSNNSLSNINGTVLLMNKSMNYIKQIFNKYSSSGCASKKFDGVIFKLDRNNGINIIYESGLNASNKVSSPLHKQIKSIKGDFSLPDDSQE